MNDIPKDLIELMTKKSLEVLPRYDLSVNLIHRDKNNDWFYLNGSFRSSDEAAALLVNWLIQELKVYSVGITFTENNEKVLRWCVSLPDYIHGDQSYDLYWGYDLLPPLWQAYKAVKEIK